MEWILAIGHIGRHSGIAILTNESNRSLRSGTVPQHIYSGFWNWVTWAGTQAQPFERRTKQAHTYKAHCHNIDIVDFGKGAHRQALRQSYFNK